MLFAPRSGKVQLQGATRFCAGAPRARPGMPARRRRTWSDRFAGHGLRLNPFDPQNFVWQHTLSTALEARCLVALRRADAARECIARVRTMPPAASDVLAPLRTSRPEWTDPLRSWLGRRSPPTAAGFEVASARVAASGPLASRWSTAPFGTRRHSATPTRTTATSLKRSLGTKAEHRFWPKAAMRPGLARTHRRPRSGDVV
jgi:hypothetical protein